MHAAFAAIRSAVLRESALDLCRSAYPGDRYAAALLDAPQQRAAIVGATAGDPNWAGALIGETTTGFLSNLPQSAASELIRRGTQVSLTGRGAINVPTRAAPPVAAPWVGETAAIPAMTLPVGSAPLDPKKMGLIVGMSGEMLRYSPAEAVFRAMLLETASMSLDAAYFSADATTADGHEGLLHGLTPISLNPTTPMTDVLSALAASVGSGGAGEIVFVTGGGRAASAAVRANEFSATVLASQAVGEDTVIAVDASALVHGGGVPEIDASSETVIHMSDTPTDLIGTPGSPPTVSAPVVSYWQTDQVALRLLIPIAFAKRRADCVAYASGLSWELAP